MRSDEVRALGAVAGEALSGGTARVEELHRAIARRAFGAGGPGARPVALAHDAIATGVYAGVRAASAAAGRLGGAALAATLPADAPSLGSTPRGNALLGALNGAFGDTIHERHPALSPALAVRVGGEDVPLEPEALRAAFPAAGGRLVVFVHGLGETELSWRRRERASYGTLLEEELGLTPVVLRCNTGRHISDNGEALATLLGDLVAAWPVPVEALTLVGHSMGGMIIRSALHHGRLGEAEWLARVEHVVSLGSPYLGAPLERATNRVDLGAGQAPGDRADRPRGERPRGRGQGPALRRARPRGLGRDGPGRARARHRAGRPPPDRRAALVRVGVAGRHGGPPAREAPRGRPGAPVERDGERAQRAPHAPGLRRHGALRRAQPLRPAERPGRLRAAARVAGALRIPTAFGEAEVVPEPGRPWRVLLRLDDGDCSHVDLRDPGHLEFAYVRRLGDLVDVVAPPRRPIVALHLGGGGFTLPRYVAHTRPGSRQTVAEIDPVLLDVAREHLGLRTGRELKVRVADAGLLLERRSPASADLLVLDCFRGTEVPGHLVTPEAMGHARRVLRPGGLFAANVIDVPPLPAARALARVLAETFPHVAVVAARKVLRGRQGGNVVLVAADRGLPVRELAARALRGAAPELVLAGADAAAFAA